MTYVLQPEGVFSGTVRTSANPVFLSQQVASVMTFGSATKTKIATLPYSPTVKGAMAVSLRWSRGVNPNAESSYYYWETAIGFTLGQIGGNAYNTTGSNNVNWNASYHHRVIGEPYDIVTDSDDSAGAYGAHSLYITFPNYVKLYDVRCDVVSLCGGYQ